MDIETLKAESQAALEQADADAKAARAEFAEERTRLTAEMQAAQQRLEAALNDAGTRKLEAQGALKMLARLEGSEEVAA